MKLVSSFLICCAFLISGCQLQQNYTMNYSFSVAPLLDQQFTQVANGFKLGVPIKNVACDPATHSARLERTGDTFVVYLDLQRAEENCDLRFNAEIKGVESGVYVVEVYKASIEVSSPLLREEFSLE